MPGVGVIWKVCLSLSCLFWCGYFLSHPMCRSHSTSFLVSLKESCSMCSFIFSTFVGKGKFRSLLCCHFGLEPLGVFFNHSMNIPSLLSSSSFPSFSEKWKRIQYKFLLIPFIHLFKHSLRIWFLAIWLQHPSHIWDFSVLKWCPS